MQAAGEQAPVCGVDSEFVCTPVLRRGRCGAAETVQQIRTRILDAAGHPYGTLLGNHDNKWGWENELYYEFFAATGPVAHR